MKLSEVTPEYLERRRGWAYTRIAKELGCHPRIVRELYKKLARRGPAAGQAAEPPVRVAPKLPEKKPELALRQQVKAAIAEQKGAAKRGRIDFKTCPCRYERECWDRLHSDEPVLCERGSLAELQRMNMMT